MGVIGERVPKLVKSLVKLRVASVACGSGHTLWLSDRGVVFASGSNESGQLGQGTTGATHTFKPVPTFTRLRLKLAVDMAVLHLRRAAYGLAGGALVCREAMACRTTMETWGTIADASTVRWSIHGGSFS